MTKPSKELLSEVLGVEVHSVEVSGNILKYNEHFVINIYEFSYLCKIWALDKGFFLEESVMLVQAVEIHRRVGNHFSFGTEDYSTDNIFEVCDYILKETKGL